MSITFYYSPMSTASITELVIAELGIPVERVKLDIRGGETKKPEFLKLNPNGVVPLIVHDGTPIFESAAITMYLGEMFGVEKNLYPAPGPKRGEAMKWITWANVTLGEAIGRYGRNTQAYYPDDQKNAKAGEAAKADIAKYVSILDGALADRDYLVGSYTLADTHLTSMLDWLRFMKAIDFAPYQNLAAWSARCQQRPVYQKMMAAMAAAMSAQT